MLTTSVWCVYVCVCVCVGNKQTTEATPLSLREIQELEQRRAQEEASKKKKSSSSGGAEPITKLLWETRVGGNEPVPLSEIMAQVRRSTAPPQRSGLAPLRVKGLTTGLVNRRSAGGGGHSVGRAQ